MTSMGDIETGKEQRGMRGIAGKRSPGIREQGNKRQTTTTMKGHQRGDGEKEDFPNQALPVLQN